MPIVVIFYLSSVLLYLKHNRLKKYLHWQSNHFTCWILKNSMQLKAVIRRTTGCKFYQLLPEKENAAIADNISKGMWRWSGSTLCWQVTSIICQSLDGSHPRKCNEKELTLRWRRPQQVDLWIIKMTTGGVSGAEKAVHDWEDEGTHSQWSLWGLIINFPQFKFTKLIQKFKLTKFLLIPVSLAMILQNLT